MITNKHYIEIYINGEKADILSQEDLDININRVIFDPTEASTQSAEYSYSFNLPDTPRNNKIFNYANNLSQTNKFHSRYGAIVYADGYEIFNGSLTVESYDYSSKQYECNFVNIKVSSIEDIFGDSVLTDIPWLIDFEGAQTINSVNQDLTTKYFFPLVSYGVFEKDPYLSDDVSNDYTSKFLLDEYAKFWIQTFPPSLNILEAVKRAFEWKGYEVLGNAFTDNILPQIFCSTNLADDQVPKYNIGNPKFGKVNISADFSNTSFNTSSMISQDLSFPYFRVTGAPNSEIGANQEEFNYSVINFWNLIDSDHNSGVTVTLNEMSYMYDPGQALIVIPQSGWYKIAFKARASVEGIGGTMNVNQWYTSFKDGASFEETQMSLTKNISETCPVEIQLIRNYDNNVELIKGRNNRQYATGNPNDKTYTYSGNNYTGGTYDNLREWVTDFPHQDLMGSYSPTKYDSILVTSQSQTAKRYETFDTPRTRGTFGGVNQSNNGSSNNFGGERPSYGSSTNSYGYCHRQGDVMPYDQAVSSAFIAGFSTMLGGTVSVMRNGYSWSKTNATENQIFASVRGLEYRMKDGTSSATSYCENTYLLSPNNFIEITPNGFSGEVYCMVYLNENDVIEPILIQRDYNGQEYACTAHIDLTIEAISDKNRQTLQSEGANYNMKTQFPKQLNLFNFTNSGKKISEWINSILTAFNLTATQTGNFISIDKNKNIGISRYAVELDDKCSSENAIAERIEYPKSMAVQYQINTEEYGFEQSVPEEYINQDDWEKYGDSGYSIIQLSDDTYETEESNTQTDFSYTWYCAFTLKISSSSTVNLFMPIIAESQYMADGYGYEESMQHDGYGLTQRFWFRQKPVNYYLPLSSYGDEQIQISLPTNQYQGVHLSYKDTEKSLLSEYFDALPLLSSNFVKIDAYISPLDYNNLKNGALAHFDCDLYYVSEINNYDPTGNSPTELKLVKKV